ncbi:restriction endonuclease subunit S [Dyadobacter sp. CY356]|uniref:restriction endonuclease subunit S n=1 Tax=Dyadobacter sp. CY356 TaxID=2906442 RepID=UPI001F21D764|nr:restriction endonuclease subunit S [Dyadobacter sp. CY356]MCF0056122.1 restriction endonuclease subunit S [Dyadobacter sp. CY356]
MFEKYSEYRDSGNVWLGDIPKSWQLKKLKTIASFINRGVTPSYVEQSDFRVVNQATFSKGYFDADNCKFTKVGPFEKIGAVKGTVFKNDILLASTGGGVLGKVAFFDLNKNNYLADSHVTIIRGDDNFHAKFYYYIFSINYDLINGILAQGSTNQTELQRDWLRDLVFPVPSLAEQTAIANFLDRKTAQIDQAVSIKEKQIELLKERRQILIHNAVTRGLSLDVKMKDSGVEWIGEIPEHWEVFANRVLFTERNQPGREGLPLLSVSIHTAISSEELDEESNIRGKVKIEDKSNYKLVEVNDIVFNMMRAWQGAIGAVGTNGMVSPAYVVAKPNKNIEANYAEYQFRTSIYIQEMNRVSKGITDFRKRLYWHEFKQLTTVVPPYKEQKEIVSYIENINQKIATAISLKQKEIEKLKEYKSTLINSAVTGKIKV